MEDLSNQPLSEQFRLAANAWVELDAAARLLEDTKSTVLSERMKQLGDVPAAHAERDVKASKDWREFIESMVQARTKANRAKLKLEWLRMRFSEQQSFEATARVERRL